MSGTDTLITEITAIAKHGTRNSQVLSQQSQREEIR